MNRTGYIYFASNVSMPGLLKVGATTASPSERLPELQSTGVPTPFVLEACIRVSESTEAEKRVHALLAKWRQTANREFFLVSVADALAQCVPGITRFLVAASNAPQSSGERLLPEDEVKVLLLVAQRTQKNDRPTRRDITGRLNFSDMKCDYVLGSLLKRRLIREVLEERESHHGPDYCTYKLKVIKLEHTGIQYLLDNRLMSPTDL